MKTIKLSKKQQDLIWSLLKPYSEGCTTTFDDKGYYFTGVNNKKFYAQECQEVMALLVEAET